MKTKLTLIAATLVAATVLGDRMPADIIEQATKLTDSQQQEEFANSLTQKEWGDVCRYMLDEATTNKNLVVYQMSVLDFPKTAYFKKDELGSLAKEYDGQFAQMGIPANPMYYSTVPNMCEVFYATRPDTVEAHPASVAFTRLHKNSDWWDEESGWTLPEQVNFICGELHMTTDQTYERLSRRVPPIVKRQLRREGKTFVGNTLVQDAVNDFASGWNSPKKLGLKTWVARWCPTHTWIEVPVPSDELIQARKDAIFYGDDTFSDFNKIWLKACLGVDAYNEFVKEYNGTSEQK